MINSKLNVLVVGTGEYTTGYTPSSIISSDKKAGVVALTLFDLRRRGMVGSIAIVGQNGTKCEAIKRHLLEQVASKYREMDIGMKYYPESHVERDPLACTNCSLTKTCSLFGNSSTHKSEKDKKAIDDHKPGDAVLIFTPDNTHFEIALYAVQRGLHVVC